MDKMKTFKTFMKLAGYILASGFVVAFSYYAIWFVCLLNDTCYCNNFNCV